MDEYPILIPVKSGGEYVMSDQTGFRSGLNGNAVPSHGW